MKLTICKKTEQKNIFLKYLYSLFNNKNKDYYN